MATTKKPAAQATPKGVQAIKPVLAKPALVAVAAPKAMDKITMVAKPAPTKAELPAKAPATKKAQAKLAHVVDPNKRAHDIQVAAFYIAERRGFAPGDTVQDYLQAAAEIDRLIAAGHFNKSVI